MRSDNLSSQPYQDIGYQYYRLGDYKTLLVIH